MAKPDKPLLSLEARGTIADTLTFQKRGQLTIARKKPIPKDPRSPAQLAWRQVYRDAVTAWHALTAEEKEAWRGVCPGLTAYQCFMRSELQYVEPPPPPEEYTEEQTQYDYDWPLYIGLRVAIGQRLTIPNREVTKLGFWIFKVGSPAGDVTFRIYRVSDNSLVAEKVLRDAADLAISVTYEEVTLDTPVTINEEVRIAPFFQAGDASNHIEVAFQSTDVKANEIWTTKPNAAWGDSPTRDCAYRYKYYEV